MGWKKFSMPFLARLASSEAKACSRGADPHLLGQTFGGREKRPGVYGPKRLFMNGPIFGALNTGGLRTEIWPTCLFSKNKKKKCLRVLALI
jgi:hypothetical protein